jgi:hypothetical protein
MKWTRADAPTLCGGCPRLIPTGEPMAVMTLPGIKRGFLRCQFCAGGAPPDLPAAIQTRSGMAPIASMARLGLLPLDEQQPREPGEEG